MEKSKIELQNISKSYYSEAAVTQALRKVSLTFVHGEFVAITGESGSGKSHKCELKQAILVKLLYGTRYSGFFGIAFFLTNNVNTFYL